MRSQLADLETAFKALADHTRLRIVGLLLHGEICVCHIHESLQVPQPTASRHLAYLRRAGLVETRRDGLWIYYRLAGLRDPVLRTLIDAVRHALTHVSAVERDLRRLGRTIGETTMLPHQPAATCCDVGADDSPRRPGR